MAIEDGVCENCSKQGYEDSECECGGIASRQLSAPRSFGNTTGKSPSSSYTKPR